MATILYRSVIATLDRVVPTKLRPMWEHPTGPKTIFFWAPAMKWGLVIAGLSDLARPVENISSGQTVSLAATGLIWSRYSMVIIPKNYPLFSVNCFVALSSLTQLGRIGYSNYVKGGDGDGDGVDVTTATVIEADDPPPAAIIAGV